MLVFGIVDLVPIAASCIIVTLKKYNRKYRGSNTRLIQGEYTIIRKHHMAYGQVAL